MHDEIDLAPSLFNLCEDSGQIGVIVCITGQRQRGAQLLSQRLNALFKGTGLKGQGKLCTLLAQFLGDPIGDGMVVGDAHHQAALALHKSAHFIRPLRCPAA